MKRNAEMDFQILKTMLDAARQGDYWLTANAIARLSRVSHPTCRIRLHQLASIGFLIMRNSDINSQSMLYALKKEFRR
jgi:RIO-like serine/threonine protein kinase